MATVEEVLNDMSTADVIGSAANIEYLIDNELRIITVPQNGVVLGVEGDKDVNVVHFKMPRMYRGLDLGEGFNIRVNYANAKAELGYFAVVRPDVTEDSISFEWLLGSHALMYVGEIKFAVSLIKSSVDGRIEKKFNTTLGKAQCLTGLDVDVGVPEEDVYDLLTQIKQDVMADIQPSLDEAKADTAAAKQSATQAAESAATASTGAENVRLGVEAVKDAVKIAEQTSAHVDEVKTAVEASATAAGSDAAKAEAAKTAAVTAQGKAEAAKTSAEQFKTAAEQAKDDATAQAQAAAQSAEAAEQAKTEASTSKTAAAESAKQAKASQDAASESANVSKSNADEAKKAANDARTIASELEERILYMHYDERTGRYTNTSIEAWLRGKRNGLTYGVEVPKSNIVECTKIGANQGIAVPTPGKIGTPAIDPYSAIGGPFFYMEVNGGCENSGVPYVSAINGDKNFSRAHSDEDTCILTPVLYTREVETDTTMQIYISDTKYPGYEPEAGAILPDGTLRPYMLRAKYPLSKDSQGRPRSTSGIKPLIRTVSHNSLIDIMNTKTTGYSGKTQNDEWYVKIMFLMKYATKNSQKYFVGCTGHTEQFRPTVAEQNVNRVIVAKANADKIPVGSSMIFGTNTSGNNDRGQTTSFDIFDGAKITKIETYDSSNSAIYFEDISPFSTETTYLLSTAPWICGACDSVSGDGSPTNRTSGREPYTIQGIELGHGMYEVLGNVILSNADGTGWKVYVNPDSQKEATSITGDYIDTGVKYDGGTADAWHYYQYPKTVNGLMLSLGSNASTSTGICDGAYLNKNATTGTREWLSLGNLGGGSVAGLWCVGGGNWLGGAWWGFGSRRSYIGRSKG